MFSAFAGIFNIRADGLFEDGGVNRRRIMENSPLASGANMHTIKSKLAHSGVQKLERHIHLIKFETVVRMYGMSLHIYGAPQQVGMLQQQSYGPSRSFSGFPCSSALVAWERSRDQLREVS